MFVGGAVKHNGVLQHLLETLPERQMIKLEEDVRLIRRNLAKGFVSRAEVQGALDALPDVADRGEWITIEDDEDAEEEEADNDE